MNQQIKDYRQWLNNSVQTLSPFRDLIEQIDDLNNIEKEFSQKIERNQDKARKLNIAIMGRVKAGKSTFLNSLLFGGKPILPEAATPKTANLTRISWGEQPCFEVEYYTPDEWQEIENKAQQNHDSTAIKAAKEAVSVVQKSNINVQQILQKGKETIQANNLTELEGKLNQYIGNNGDFAPLVKMTHLFLNHEELKGFDVVDTPGMNDPVTSRTERTKEEMARCDAVLFLSLANSFLDQSDMSLLAEQLPNKGIKRMILIASQYDSAINNDGYNRDSLSATETNIHTRLNRQAKTQLTPLIEQREKAGNANAANLLRQIESPIFASTYANAYAEYPTEQWQQSESMKHSHENLCEIAQTQWNGYQFTQQDWQRIAGFEKVRSVYQQVRSEKAQLIEQQIQSLIPDSQTAFRTILERIGSKTQDRIDILKNKDLKDLDNMQKKNEHYVLKVSETLQEVIDSQIESIQNQQKSLSRDIKKSISQYNTLTTSTGTETRTKSYTVSISKIYNPFSWWKTETRYRDYEIDYQYASTSDAISLLNEYARDSAGNIEQLFNEIISPAKLKKQLKQSLVNLLPTERTDFNPLTFQSLLNDAIQKLAIPEFNLDISNIGQEIAANFRGEVRNRQIEALKKQLYQSLNHIAQSLAQSLSDETQQLCRSLTALRNNLANHLTEEIHQELQQLKKDCTQKEQMLAQYQQLHQQVHHIQQEIPSSQPSRRRKMNNKPQIDSQDFLQDIEDYYGRLCSFKLYSKDGGAAKETIINAPFLEKDMNYEEHISRNTPLADIVAKVREMDGRTSINNSADELKFKSHREECTVNFVNTERNLVAVHETDFSISLVSALGGLNSLDSNQAFITNTFKPKIALGDFSIKAGEKNNVGFITDISGSDFKGAYEVLNDLSRMGGVSGGLWRNINDSLTKEVNYILKLGLGIDDISITNYSSDILELVDVIGDECGSIFKDAFIEYLDSSIKTIIQMPTESIYSNLRDSFLSDDTEINCSMENLPIFYSNIKTVVFAAGSHEPPFGFKLEVGEVGIIKDKYFDTFKKVLEVGNEVDSASVVTSDGLVYLVRRGIVDKGRIALLRLV